MKQLLQKTWTTLLLSTLLLPTTLSAEDYIIDTEGMHAAIQFKIKHLGYSWLVGRFDNFGGTFTYDKENPSNSKIEVTVKPLASTPTMPNATNTYEEKNFWK